MSDLYLEIADPLQWTEIQQGRRSALAFDRLFALKRGDVVSIGLQGQPIEQGIRRRVQFVDIPRPSERFCIIGFDWVDAGAADAVRLKVDEAMGIEHYRLQMALNGQPIDQEQRRSMLTGLFTEIRRAVGAERFDTLPAEMLDQFSVQSLVQNHDTHGLLNSLINSFLISYCIPETSAGAFDCLTQIESLRADAARIRRRHLEQVVNRSARAH